MRRRASGLGLERHSKVIAIKVILFFFRFAMQRFLVILFFVQAIVFFLLFLHPGIELRLRQFVFPYCGIKRGQVA